MLQWLQKKYNLKQSDISQKGDLEKLREKVKEYRKKYNKEDKEMEVSSESDSEVDEEEQKRIDEEMRKRQQKKKGMRTSVSAEVYGIHNVKKPYVPRVIPKTSDQIERIKDKCMQSFIFNSLEDKELKTVIDSFEEKKYKAGQNVITQGEEGDVLYLVDSGELDCEKVFKAGDPPTYLKTYKPGESFGELALLYNAPRAATIRAKTDSTCWALDRECFNNIVKDAAMKKREKYENTLKKVEILKSIDPYELGQICDALKTQNFSKGDYIIKQGEKGDIFFILDDGKAHAEKVFDQGKKPQKVKDYESGGFFGELALLKNEPRAASIVADTNCRCLSLDRMAFKRLLGPLENILQRNSENYIKYMKK
jgi:cAMP-dependent protein kinase regulator